jgi:hypothetical protein
VVGHILADLFDQIAGPNLICLATNDKEAIITIQLVVGIFGFGQAVVCTKNT